MREIAGSIVFLRKIVRGGASRSFGVEVAALAGVPEEVTTRAKVILKELERGEKKRIKEHGQLSEETAEAEPEEQGLDLRAELRELDVNRLTPMQALALISEWKEKCQ